MPSSEKTAHLQLNSWVGADKPKRNDFNEDNRRLDQACRDISQQLNVHTQSTALHVTQAEKNRWNNSSGITVGTYTGNGSLTQAVELGATPAFGYIFAVGQPPSYGVVDKGVYRVYSGAFGKQGCTYGIELKGTKLEVVCMPTSTPDGLNVRLNEAGTTYIYAFWK